MKVKFKTIGGECEATSKEDAIRMAKHIQSKNDGWVNVEIDGWAGGCPAKHLVAHIEQRLQ